MKPYATLVAATLTTAAGAFTVFMDLIDAVRGPVGVDVVLGVVFGCLLVALGARLFREAKQFDASQTKEAA